MFYRGLTKAQAKPLISPITIQTRQVSFSTFQEEYVVLGRVFGEASFTHAVGSGGLGT